MKKAKVVKAPEKYSPPKHQVGDLVAAKESGNYVLGMIVNVAPKKSTDRYKIYWFDDWHSGERYNESDADRFLEVLQEALAEDAK